MQEKNVRDRQAELGQLQQALREKGTPVILIFEGFGASGKGTLISQLMVNLDPRGFKVHSVQSPSRDEQLAPFLRRYWPMLPGKGKIAIFDRSWYRDVTLGPLEEKMDDKQIFARLGRIADMEQMLAADGYLIVKFFLDISRKEQKARFKALEKDKDTRWRVTGVDWDRYAHYDRLRRHFMTAIEQTNTSYSPWHLIDARDRDRARDAVYERVIAALSEAVSSDEKPEPAALSPLPVLPISRLDQVDLTVSIEPKDYDKRLKKAQKRLSRLHNRLYLTRTPLILAFEGWDAAGKGGAIKRLARALDPRGYEVVPVASPTPEEKAHQHLWRFWTQIPKDGHVAIFDRTWYGRVMVERIEGFCSEAAWQRAYEEINHFEEELTEHGAIVIKFWLHISREEQLRRFEERQNTPEKRWKITQEDWRNREKWPEYEEAVNEMLARTHRKPAPWVIVEGESKKFARLKVLETVIEAIERRLS